MAWNPLDNPVDIVMLGGAATPGLTEITGADSPRKWEKRQGYGFGGATLWYKGLDLSEFKLHIHLFTVADWIGWDSFKPIVKRPPIRSRPRALDIWHPLLEDLDIKSVVVTNVEQPTQVADGEWVIVVSLTSYRRFKLSLAKPEASKPKEETDPWEKYIDQLNAGNQVYRDQLATLQKGG